MIYNNAELTVALERISRFQAQVLRLRDTASSEENYRAAAGAFLAEIDRLTLEVREFLWIPPTRSSGRVAVA